MGKSITQDNLNSKGAFDAATTFFKDFINPYRRVIFLRKTFYSPEFLIVSRNLPKLHKIISAWICWLISYRVS